MKHVGDPAAGFTLRGQDGELHSLDDLLIGKRSVVLAFYLFDFSPT